MIEQKECAGCKELIFFNAKFCPYCGIEQLPIEINKNDEEPNLQGTFMIKDDFFTKEKCDRCKNKLTFRVQSFFTGETICMECSKNEDLIKLTLKKQGKNIDLYEDCGYLPRRIAQNK